MLPRTIPRSACAASAEPEMRSGGMTKIRRSPDHVCKGLRILHDQVSAKAVQHPLRLLRWLFSAVAQSAHRDEVRGTAGG